MHNLTKKAKKRHVANNMMPHEQKASQPVSRVLLKRPSVCGLRLLAGSSHLPRAAGQAMCSLHGVAPDRVYSAVVSPRGG